ncbi:MAG: insulinase family protein [Prolixibacteraceae bacterium]|nr:insulinase family protein [Prolixibacteraceae bacterium]
MINRNNPPEVKQNSQLHFIEPEVWKLSNGIPVWGLNAGSQELVKIDLIFEAGTWYQPMNLVAGLCNAFLNQGTSKYSAQEIAEAFDYRGAYLQLSADQHFASVSVLVLNKYIDEVLEVTASVVQHAIFPDREINAQIGKKKQQFMIENNKVKTLAQKKFSQVLFGMNHPYSNSNQFSDYDRINSEQLTTFYQSFYHPSNCMVLLAGKYNGTVVAALEQYFGASAWPVNRKKLSFQHHLNPSTERNFFVEKKDGLQSAIRMGMIVPNREHPDFHGLNVLSTVLGGYFGSRLMTNIREDKGYTYGIGSAIYSMPKAAYFTISTEVGNDVTRAALHEIYAELDHLCNDLVPEEELQVVKNYMMGELLRSFDGVFAMSASLRNLIEVGLGYDHYRDLANTITHINAERLRELAQKYLRKESIYEVIAGNETC